MKIAQQLSLSLLLTAVSLFAAPAPNSVQNPGSNTVPGLPNYGTAQGSVFVVYGTGMGPSTIVTTPALPYQTSLGGTSITVTVAGTTVNALVVYTLATQVAAILPSNTPVGTGTLTLTYNNASGSTPITVVASNFGILSVNQTGTGPVVATHADYSVISGASTANTGETIIIWGTGLGPLPAGVSDATSPGSAGANIGTITIWLGGVQATNVRYHGRNPSDPGLDQINFDIPSGVSGCYVSLVIQTANQVSNTTTLAVSPNGTTCSDADGISFSSLSSVLNSSGSVRLGTAGVTQTQLSFAVGGISSNTTTVTGSARFEKYSGLQLSSSGSPFAYPSIGSCTDTIIYPNSSSTPTVNATGLDAGTPIVLTPPSGSSVNLTTDPQVGKGYYSTAANALTSMPSGNWKFAGPGGTDVGAFNASLTVPAALTWSNETTVTASPVGRSQALKLTWTGGDPNSYVIIEGFSINPSPAVSGSVGAFFLCVAPTAPGSFTIPPSVLLSLPATGATQTSFGALYLGSIAAPQPFTAPGIDFGYVYSSSLSGTNVTWQ